MNRWVATYPGVPDASLFSTTGGLGTPIIVDETTDTPYYLKDGVVTALVGGGGGATVSSVFGRSGAVAAVAGDYDFAEIGATPTTVAGYGITDFDTRVQANRLDQLAAPTASVDFSQEQALSFCIENRTSDPGAPATGQIWLRTDL